jgi:hypothetical protein
MQQMEDGFQKYSIIQPQLRMKHKMPTVKTEKSAYSSKGWNRSHMA